MSQRLPALLAGLCFAAELPAAVGITARAAAESFSLNEPVSIEMNFGDLQFVSGYLITIDPPASNPPMALFNSAEAGFGFPIRDLGNHLEPGASPPARHMVLLNKWVGIDRPGRYTVTIDTMVGPTRVIRQVPITVVARDEARLQTACRFWGERANGRSIETESLAAIEARLEVATRSEAESMERLGLPRSLGASAQSAQAIARWQHDSQRTYAQQVMMYLHDPALIPCLIESASDVNLAPAIALREMDSVAAVTALQQLMRSAATRLAGEARLQLGKLQERTTRNDVREAAQRALAASHP